MATAAIAASLLPSLVLGHGATTWPPPRNAIDSDEMPWGGKVPNPVPFEPWCPIPSEDASKSDPGRNLTGANGQACFWFSNGCAIGCDACDGSTRGPIPNFECVPGTGSTNNCTLKPSGREIPMGPKAPVCSTPLNATVCEPSQRTVNTDAPCGGPTDYFYYSPWRRPGSAPVIDSCGSAGGRIAGQGAGDFGARYQNTTHAKIGDLGSNLPYIPSSVEWVAGNDYEVSWTLQANHGGGYSYRLCPLGSTLDEECFKKLPLNFTGMSKLRWGGKGGHSVMFNATYVTQGTSPEGSMWAKNPIPRAWRDVHGNWGKGSNQFQTGEGFQPVCIDNGEDPIGNQYSCTGMWGPYNLEIVDRVVIPDNIPTGKYVLGFRWDCEESNQIWQSCSDINVINNKPLPPTTTPQGFTCGTPGNNAGMQLKNSPIAAPNPCYCATLCYDNPDCKAWTYSSSTFKRQGKGCYLRSEYGPVVDNCDVKGDCFSGQTRT